MLTRSLLLLACSVAPGCLVPPDGGSDTGPCGDGISHLGESCDDGNEVDGDGCSAQCRRERRIDITWQITDLAGTALSCPAGFDTVEITGIQSAPRTFLFPCASGQASVSVLDMVYDLSVRIQSSTTGEVWGSSPTERLMYQSKLAAKLYVDAGHLSLEWGFANAAGAAISCNPGEEATVTLSPEGVPGEPLVETVDCQGRLTGPLPPGTYTGTISSPRGRTTPLPGTIAIEPRSKVTSVGPVLMSLY